MKARVHRLMNHSSWNMRGFVGSIVMGITKCRGWSSPTEPQNNSDPVRALSLIEAFMNSLKLSQDLLLGNSIKNYYTATFVVV